MQFIIFDLEATCWDGNLVGRRSEIIEIGALRVTPYGEVTEQFQRFVRPVDHPQLSVYCKNLTGINQQDINSARTFAIVCNDFLSWVNGEPYVMCSWGAKDIELLEADCDNHEIATDWLANYIDLKEQYHLFKGLNRKRGLVRVLRKEGLDFEGDHHRALDDATNLAALFNKYLDAWMY